MRHLSFVLLFVAVPAATAPAQQRYPAPVEAKIGEQRAACVSAGGKLTIGKDAVGSAELDGDGKPDYLLNHYAFECSRGTNGYCGSRGCWNDVFLSSQGYREVDSFQGGVTIDRSHAPAWLRISDRSGSATRRWNGSRFAAPGSSPAAEAPRAAQPAPVSAWTVETEGQVTFARSPRAGEAGAITVRCAPWSKRGYRVTFQLPARRGAGPVPFILFGANRIDLQLTRADGLWVVDPENDDLLNLLSGAETGLAMNLDGRGIGAVSLAGSTRAIRSALATCGRQGARDGAAQPARPAADKGRKVSVAIPIRPGHWVHEHEDCASSDRIYRFDPKHMWVSTREYPAYSEWTFAAVIKLAANQYQLKCAQLPPGEDGGACGLVLTIESPNRAIFAFEDEEPVKWCRPESIPAYRR